MKKEFNLEIFNRMLDKVVKWNAIGGNSVDNKDLIPTYVALSREEFFGKDEFLQGWFSGDKVMQADGLGDLVFTFGFLCKLLRSEDILSTDKYLILSGIKSRVVAIAYDLLDADDLQDQDNDFLLWYEDLYALCLKFSEIMDVEGVFNTIYESNMSKYLDSSNFWTKEERDLALHKEVDYIISQGRYAEVSYYESNGYIVFTAEKDLQSGVVFPTPKIVKPSCFQEVIGLEQFIY